MPTLPDGEGWGEDLLTEMNTHCGTTGAAPARAVSFVDRPPRAGGVTGRRPAGGPPAVWSG